MSGTPMDAWPEETDGEAVAEAFKEMMRPRMKAPTRKQAKAAAIAAHSQIVRHNADGCAADGVLQAPCGTGSIQCAHIVPKHANTIVAVDIAPQNGWALCPGHHIAVDTDQSKWAQLVAATVGFDTVAAWRAQSDRAAIDGLYVNGRPASKLIWWRHQVARLDTYRYAPEDLTMPRHIRLWLAHPDRASRLDDPPTGHDGTP